MADLTIRNVPEPVVRILKTRAAEAGMSFQDYLLAILTREAERGVGHSPVLHQLLDTQTVTVNIDYSQFYVWDYSHQLGEEVPIPPTFHDSLGVGERAVSVPSTIQSHHATVHTELWDGQPPAPHTTEFVVGEADIESRGATPDYPEGAVVVFALMGSDHPPMPLAGAGNYRIRILRTPENARPDWEKNWEQRHDGYEVYRVQLWRRATASTTASGRPRSPRRG